MKQRPFQPLCDVLQSNYKWIKPVKWYWGKDFKLHANYTLLKQFYRNNSWGFKSQLTWRNKHNPIKQ